MARPPVGGVPTIASGQPPSPAPADWPHLVVEHPCNAAPCSATLGERSCNVAECFPARRRSLTTLKDGLRPSGSASATLRTVAHAQGAPKWQRETLRGGLDEACNATGVFCIVVGALPIVARALPGLGERSLMFLPCSALQWKRSVVLLERSRFLHPRSAADRPASGLR